MPRRRERATRIGAWVLIAIGLGAIAARGSDPEPEHAYPHRSFSAHEYGQGVRSYWLFEPAQPAPKQAPVVVFLHGWLAVNPGVYGAWIEHLTRSGRIVVYPRYHGDWTTHPSEFLPNASSAVRDALDVLRLAPGHVRPDRERMALIGHSAGANLAVMMAASASENGLPRPKAVVAIFPGEVRPIRSPGAGSIPGETILVVAAGENDWIVGDGRARQVFAEATAIPANRKKYIFYRTDTSGPISLIADHVSPTAALARLDSGEGPLRSFQMNHAGLDILDRYGFWRMADLTLAAAFLGRTLDETTARGASFRDLGRWRDGRPILAPIVGDDLTEIPRTFPAHGARLLPLHPDDYFGRVSRGRDRPAQVASP